MSFPDEDRCKPERAERPKGFSETVILECVSLATPPPSLVSQMIFSLSLNTEVTMFELSPDELLYTVLFPLLSTLSNEPFPSTSQMLLSLSKKIGPVLFERLLN